MSEFPTSTPKVNPSSPFKSPVKQISESPQISSTPDKVITDVKSPTSIQKRDQGKRVIVAPVRQYDIFSQTPKVKSKSNNKRKGDAPLTGSKKKKLEELEKEIADSNNKINNLTQQRSRVQKSLDEAIKFPCKDELIKEYDKTGNSIKPLPKSTAVIKFPEDIISELIGVWEFLNIFKLQLNLIPIGIDQFADLLRYTGRSSVALTEIFIAPLRMLLTDPIILEKINDAIPKKASIAVKPNKDINFDFNSYVNSNEISGWDGSGNFDIGYNGIALLPSKIHPEQLDPLKWQAILRTVLLRLEPVKNLRLGYADITTHHDSILSLVEGKVVELTSLKKNLSCENLNLITNTDNKKTISELAVTGGESRHRTFPYNKDALLKLSSDVVVPLETLKQAAIELESKELHELTPRHKLAILKILCESCFDTQHIKELLENNAEERANRMTQQRKIEAEKILKKKEISKEKKDEAHARCRKYNIATIPAPKALTEAELKNKPGPKKTGPGSRGGTTFKVIKDIWEPKQDQLNAMIDEMTLLESLGVDDVFDYLPEDVLEEIDEEDNDDTNSALYADDGTLLRRSRASIRSEASEKKKRNQEVLIYNNNLHMVYDQIKHAISMGSEKELRLAIKAGLKAGLRIESDDGTISIHSSLRDAYKLQKEIIVRQEEEKITAAHEKSLEQYVLRTNCLGTDRNHNSYWIFSGDNDRLFVQEKILIETSSLNKNDKQIVSIAKAFSENNKNFGQIYSSRPNKYKYKWVIYSTEREIWDLYDALDNRGERENALKSAIKSRFELDEPPIVYLNTGSDYIGRKVRRQFGRKKPIIGTVVGWAPQVKYDPAIWHIVHDDGDQEDLEEEELQEYLIDEDEVGGAGTKVVIDASIDSNTIGNTGSMIIGNSITMEDDDDEPELVVYYNNSTKFYQAVRQQQLGLNGLQQELLRVQGILLDGLKKRGSNYSKEYRKMWETSVKDSTNISDLRRSLQELEEVVHSVQLCEDKNHEEIDKKKKESERKAMIKEGWIFDSELNEYIGKKGRRFFIKYGKSDGTFIGYLPADKNEGLEIWLLVHDDGDEEDLDENGVKKAIRLFDEDIQEDDEPVVNDDNDMNEEEDDENDDNGVKSNIELDYELEYDESILYHNYNIGTDEEKTLWPSGVVRNKWLTSVQQSNTIGEVALALSCFNDYAKRFGVTGDDPLDGLNSNSKSSKNVHNIQDNRNTPRKKSKSNQGRDDEFSGFRYLIFLFIYFLLNLIFYFIII